MEERSGARHLSQRHLGEEGEGSAPPEERAVPASRGGDTPPASEAVDRVPALEGPPDARLRERRRVWWQERARFEASRRRTAADESPPP